MERAASLKTDEAGLRLSHFETSCMTGKPANEK
jgi:hypothetical protein